MLNLWATAKFTRTAYTSINEIKLTEYLIHDQPQNAHAFIHYFFTSLIACDSGTVNPAAQVNELEIADKSSSVTTQSFTAKRYVGNLDYVIGDVKQGLITNQLNSTAKIDNLLKGFKEMGVNGLRVPIYPVNSNPNQVMFDYLYG